jgi:hypothetical protein
MPEPSGMLKSKCHAADQLGQAFNTSSAPFVAKAR